MIVDGLLNFVSAGLVWLAGLLPQSDDLYGFLANFGLVTQNLAALNYYLPLAEVFGLVLGVFYLLPIFLGTTTVLWIISFVRGASARG